VFGLDGYPLHQRGLVQGAPGIAFVGMRYQYRAGSALLGGVGEDAEYVVSKTVSFLRLLNLRSESGTSHQQYREKTAG